MTVATPTSAQKDDTDVFPSRIGRATTVSHEKLSVLTSRKPPKRPASPSRPIGNGRPAPACEAGFRSSGFVREFEVSIEWMLTGEGSFLEDSKEKLLARLFHKGLLTDAGRPFIAGAMTRH